jgi:alpha-beta hydrolase superfamily lysophospholipase
MVALVAVLTAAVGGALAQNAAPKANANPAPNAKAGRNAKGAAPGPGGAAAPAPGRGAAPGQAQGQGQGAAPKAGPGDPLMPDAQAKAWAPGTYHYTLKLVVTDNTALAASYYPSKLGTNASVVLLVHEKDRSSKDFEEPIADVKGQGLAEYLQDQGHAVLALDLRGQGANLRRPLTPQDWQAMVYDLQAAYWFLVDRTNRGELNLSKLAVIGLGEGANLAAAWAYQPAAAVSGMNRVSDLCALVLISPMADGEGLLLGKVTGALAPRFPLLVMVGKDDRFSYDPVRAVRSIVENPLHKQNKVEVFDSALHGYKLLRLEPKVTSGITRFLEGTAKYKAVEWEPRYNLSPIAFRDVAIVRNPKAAEAAKEAQAKEEPAKKPAAAKEAAAPKEKQEAVPK